MNTQEEKSYDEIGNEALEVLSSFFFDLDSGEEGALFLDVLSYLLGNPDTDDVDDEDSIESLTNTTFQLANLVSGLLIHVVNLIRVISMMSGKHESEAYRNYVDYFHILLPKYGEIESEADAISYISKMYEYFANGGSDEVE